MIVDTLTIKLMSLAVHAEEFIETGEPLDAAAIRGLLSDGEVAAMRSELEAAALLPVKRDQETQALRDNQVAEYHDEMQALREERDR